MAPVIGVLGILMAIQYYHSAKSAGKNRFLWAPFGLFSFLAYTVGGYLLVDQVVYLFTDPEQALENPGLPSYYFLRDLVPILLALVLSLFVRNRIILNRPLSEAFRPSKH